LVFFDVLELLLRAGVPWLEVDATDGYRPGFSQILSFVNARD